MKITASKNLPHRENGPPASASTGRPRATPRQGSRPLTGGRRLWYRISRLVTSGASAPAASFSLFGGRGAATGQGEVQFLPFRLGLSPATRLRCRERLWVRGGQSWCRRGRGVSVGAVRSACPLPWCPRPQASTSPRGRPSRIRSRRDAITSESSLSSSPSPPSSSLGLSSSGSPPLPGLGSKRL